MRSAQEVRHQQRVDERERGHRGHGPGEARQHGRKACLHQAVSTPGARSPSNSGRRKGKRIAVISRTHSASARMLLAKAYFQVKKVSKARMKQRQAKQVWRPGTMRRSRYASTA